MFVVREIFVAKPGQAGKLAKLCKKGMPEMKVMTDYMGDFNTVVIEQEVATLAEWEKMMEDMRAGKGPKMDPAVEEEFKHYTDMYLTGRREVWRIH